MPRLFELIESPEPGWTTRKMEKAAAMLGEDAEWCVELQRLSDGATVVHHHADLHLAWVRACEQAHGLNIKLDEPEDAPAGVRASYSEPFVLDEAHTALADRVNQEQS